MVCENRDESRRTVVDRRKLYKVLDGDQQEESEVKVPKISVLSTECLIEARLVVQRGSDVEGQASVCRVEHEEERKALVREGRSRCMQLLSQY